MVSEELTSYIKHELDRGQSQEAIIQKLQSVGWDNQQINEAFRQKRSFRQKPLKYLYDLLTGSRKFRASLAALLLAVISGVLISYPYVSKASSVLNNFEDKATKVVEEIFPEDLEIKIEKGKASTNVTEPYFLTVSTKTLQEVFSLEKDGLNKPQAKVRLLTVNTKGKAEDFERFQSLAMLTSSSLVYYDDDAIKIQPLSTIPDTTITRQFLLDKFKELQTNYQLVTVLKILLYLSPVLIIFVFFLYYLLEVSSIAFFSWVINKIHKTAISFKRLFGLAGALYLIPALLLTIIRLIPPISIFYQWFYTALDVIILAFVYALIVGYKESLPDTL